MPCYFPLVGVDTGAINLETGKKIIAIHPHGTQVDESQCLDVFPIPCGHCIGCRLDRSRLWADRCMLELMYHERACFITLTYDDFHIPRRFYGSSADGTAKPCFTLLKRDFQLFIKRLRKANPSLSIRYFACGEYGPSTFRPHYHAILFGIDFDDREELPRASSSGMKLYTSEKLNKAWSFPPRNERGESYSPNSSVAGIATVQDVTWETCAYTARYVQKKLYGNEARFYEKHNLVPPFSLMSRRPGIGRRYLDDHPEVFDYSHIHIATCDGGRSINIPKYYLKILETTDAEKADALKRVRKQLALEHRMTLESQLQIPYDEYLHQLNDVKLKKIKSLTRSDL
uniref:Replication initiator protein n=1 Tax=Dulem virus 128 TaxID=3145605 RepID=A0AAU8B1L6_9VIRU